MEQSSRVAWETGCWLRGGFGNGNESSVGEIDEQAVGMNGLGMRRQGL